MWIDDPDFNLEYHVRHSALPAPGGMEQLQDLTARIFSQQLDRSKPLWEMWLIEGLEDNRFALITKTHHSLIDGIAGVDLATVLFDLSPEPSRCPPAAAPGSPTRSRGRSALLAAGLQGAVRTGVALVEGASRRARPPRARAGPRPRSRRGHRRDHLGRAEPGAGNAPERPDRAPPAVRRA